MAELGDKNDIQARLHSLEKQKEKLRREALKAISTETWPLFEALQAECAATGHRWEYSNHNWDYSYQWDKCKWCGAMEGADKHATPTPPSGMLRERGTG